LAVQVAAALLDEFAGGVAFVDLAPICDAALVPATVATAVGIRAACDGSPAESLHSFLRDTQILLVLDNFEQVAAAAPFVADLLRAAPDLKVLVTGRGVLHLSGEHEFPVPPLRLPDSRQLPEIESLQQNEAVRLFIQRAQAVKPDFALTEANARAVAEICLRLDGLPLAIELAAARSKLLSPEALLAWVSSPRHLLMGGGPRDLPARQQTIRATIDWSYNLLAVAEQCLFVRLAVFAGGWTLAAANAVCAGDSDLGIDLLDGLQALVDKTLVYEQAGIGGEPRFNMLDTIRTYALERMEAGGEAAAVRQRHAAYYLALAETAPPALCDPERAAWLGRLKAEHDNLRAALQWARDSGDEETAARLVAALGVSCVIEGTP
jgi:predicted ATPase